ncbi:hypothetical protein AMTRI_Chr02g223570 [Amborella trichopoda]|uniref:INO80 complex subunit B-like conserved region domain-containing protein n=1 Tax=Amborella trichopoda TaxID=13333 RepID=W1NWU6_AMBTC|nr:uncharacterized protein LOC18430210 [Amborella trichopoda]XP_020520537.1 uncharacterized protein LOC18430210 [Amborella trichopoda]ERN02107.1 hypothetical protein AMTR_s00045p00162570 [Amborella trichopoda]|eukprot:XP_006840432.1 uncharacterized protein LOC18430210 [Amborella trichopoda]
MEGLEGMSFDGGLGVRKKPRSSLHRRPRTGYSQLFTDEFGRDLSSQSPTPPSDTQGTGNYCSSGNLSKGSSDDNEEYDEGFQDAHFKSRDGYWKTASVNQMGGDNNQWGMDCDTSNKTARSGGNSGGYNVKNGRYADDFYSSGSFRGSASGPKRCSEGVLAPANWKGSHRENQAMDSLVSRDLANCPNIEGNVSSRHMGQLGISSNGSGNGGSDSKSMPRKVKLKLGGVTHTIHAKPAANSGGIRQNSSGAASAMKPLRTDGSKRRQKLITQENSDDDYPYRTGKTNSLQGIPWKDFSGGSFPTKESKSKSSGEKKQSQKSSNAPSSKPVRKSKRVPKRRVLDGEYDDAEEDDEIRYLERLKTPKISADVGGDYDDDEEDENRRRGKSRGVKRRPFEGEVDEDGYEEELTSVNDDIDNSEFGAEGKSSKKRKETVDSLVDEKKEFSLTTRQRALQSGKDSGVAANLIEFPDGLPATQKKKKEKMTEVEQQLKKAEAAQRRRMQVEKANKELEAEAIRKILGQDSNRKKREDKIRKHQDELAQAKAATAMTLASSTIRLVSGPNGTTVSFPEDGLPSIFSSTPCSYPPPREKCAGPSCTNIYKYRDSKSNLPLCSLQCYRAIHQTMQSVAS